MKTLFIAFLAFVSIIAVEKDQDKMIVNATFDGYEEATYYFSGTDEISYEFQKVDSVASTKYNLQDVQYKGKKFEVTYALETDLDENDDEYSIYTILDLKLIE